MPESAGMGHRSSGKSARASPPALADGSPGARMRAFADRHPRLGLDFARSCRRPQPETRHAYVALERCCSVGLVALARRHAGRRPKTGGHAGADHPARAAKSRALHLDLRADQPGDRQGLRRPARVRLRPQAQGRAGGELGGRARRQDRHLQAAQGREIPRRQAVHLRRRAVHDHGGAEEGPPARHQHLPRRDGGRDPRRIYRRYSSSPTPRPTCSPRCRATKARCCPSTSSARATSAPMPTPTSRSAPDHSSSSNGGAASWCASTRTRTTGARVCPISIASSCASSTTRRRAPRRSKRARRMWRASARCPTATPRSWRSCPPSRSRPRATR